tara:strand:- start:13615 stop:14841 length:1227 start_codon:yes stop_codon:yes gene_type:complete
LLYQKYTKLLGLVLFFVFLLFSCQSHPDSSEHYSKIKDTIEKKDSSLLLGAERMEELLEKIGDRTVALVGNQTSILSMNQHLVDTLISRNVHLLKVFSPEHGFRGTQSAGQKIANSRDEKTGLPIVSLYGDHKKPTKEDLDNVELVVFDIQDVGVRFYTYISTLHNVMEACAEFGVPILVLDRPNPNGDYIDGPVLEMTHKSFVGMHPVPVVHGMTIGEYALMINGEYWLRDSLQCDLRVLECKNYHHSMHYSLPVPPSPNLRSDISIRLYPSLCFFEGTTISIGRGTAKPFELYGHPDLDKDNFSFKPKSMTGAVYPKHQNIQCGGVNLANEPLDSRFTLRYLIDALNLVGDPVSTINRKKFFVLLSGTEKLYNQIINGLSEKEIRKTWDSDLEAYSVIRAKYLIYD